MVFGRHLDRVMVIESVGRLLSIHAVMPRFVRPGDGVWSWLWLSIYLRISLVLTRFRICHSPHLE